MTPHARPAAIAVARASRVAALAMVSLALTALGKGGEATAESLFVIDQLVVNVSSAPGGEGERVANIKSGERVEVLDRQGDDTQVQLANGTQGWVKSAYLSADPPLQRRLQDGKAEIEKLKQNVARLEAQLAAARPVAPSGNTASSGTVPGGSTVPGASTGTASGAGTGTPPLAQTPANRAPAGPVTSPEAAPAPAASGTAAHNGSLFSDSADQSPWPVWAWASGCSLIALALGFLLGWRALDRRIRQKYGGLKIY